MLYAGQNFQAKITELRDNLLGSEHSWMVVSEKDEIAWLFNLRGEGEGTGEVIKRRTTTTTINIELIR